MAEHQVEHFLKERGVAVMDTVEITVDGPAGKKNLEGMVMPRHSASGEDVLTLKLKNGYNLGISVLRITELKVLEKATKKLISIPHVKQTPGLPSIHILSTGGTIASYVDYRTGAVHPALDASQLVAQVPELSQICNVHSKILMSKLSEDISPSDWVVIARGVKEAFDRGAAGVVIPHGTDTLGYTAAALSFMLKNLPGPVVLVGSQRSSDRPSSDATLNLLAAARAAACKGLFGVYVVMHGTPSDTYALVHSGVRVRKMHTSRRDAFASVNARPVGKVTGDEVFISSLYPAPAGKSELKDGIDASALLVQAQPGLTSEFLLSLKGRYRGMVISGTGLGHVGSHLQGALKELISSGMLVFMTSQCLSGRVNLNVYSNGRQLLDIGVLPLGDCLPETALVKLMWVLGQTKDGVKAKELMLTEIAGEMSGPADPDTFISHYVPGGA